MIVHYCIVLKFIYFQEDKKLIYRFKDHYPNIAKTVFLADYVTITGNVTIGDHSSIWFNTVIRGDVAPTIIGERVNIQDNCVLHQSPEMPLIIEDEVTVGHQAILHSSIIRKGALIGMGTTILDNAEIGEGAFIGAGSLIPAGKKIPPNTLAYGRPARVIRELTEEDRQEMERLVAGYVRKGQYYKTLQEDLANDDE